MCKKGSEELGHPLKSLISLEKKYQNLRKIVEKVRTHKVLSHSFLSFSITKFLHSLQYAAFLSFFPDFHSSLNKVSKAESKTDRQFITRMEHTIWHTNFAKLLVKCVFNANWQLQKKKEKSKPEKDC